MKQEAIYADGSRSEFGDFGSVHEGGLAIERLRLISAKGCLDVYIRTNGVMQMTRNGAQLAIKNVVEPYTGKRYARSMNGKRQALADCEALLAALEESAVVVTDES